MVVIDRSFVEAEIARHAPKIEKPTLSAVARAIVDAVGTQGEIKRLLEVRVPDLIDYQDEAYAKRYAEVIKRVVAAEAKAVPGQSGLAEAAARYLYKLMAYKDEYEVARLHTDPAFVAQLDSMFKHGYTVKYNLAPPTISKKDPVTGHLIKQQFGPWMRSAFGWMKKLKGLRGGGLDFFGKTEERHHERQMIADYVKELDGICAALSPANHAAAVALASVPDEIRGYGHVKEKSVAEAKTLREQRTYAFRNPQAQSQPQPVVQSVAA
jgi:indolepyruvate ferredoxin oxidoreductase